MAEMDYKYAADCIREHNRIHSRSEARAIFITKALDLAADVLEKSCWISCSEMLPDVDIPVLTWDGHCVSVERRIEYFLYDDEYTGHTERQYGEYWINGFEGDEENPIGLRDGAATHWMPLPSKPPEATQNE